MDTEKRLMLAFALSMLVILTFSWLNADQQQPPQRNPQSESSSAQRAGSIASATPTVSAEPDLPDRSPAAVSSQEAWNWLESSETEGEAVVESPGRYRIVFSKQGGQPVSWQLLNYEQLFAERRFLELRSEHGTPLQRDLAQSELTLLEQIESNGDKPPVNAINPFYSAGRSGLAIRWGGGRLDRDIAYESSADSLTVGGDAERLVFTSRQNGVRIEKVYRFEPESYRIEFEVHIINETEETLPFDRDGFYDLNWEGGFGFTSLRIDAMNSVHVQRDGSLESLPQEQLMNSVAIDDSMREVFLSGQAPRYSFPAETLRNQEVGWVGIGQKYFLAAIIPQMPTQFALRGLSSPRSDEFRFSKPMAGVRMGMDALLPGVAHVDRFTLYVGPMDEKEMAKAEADLQDARPMFLRSFTGPIANWMLDLLQAFYSLTPNYGVAIILLTLLVKILMFPVMHKQLKSMRKMQALQPQINALKEQYKDDPQKLQKEQLELFRRHKVNPLGGCLPIFITIPIFIALYATFSLSVELRGAPFIWWINDLSQPDAAFYLPLGAWILDINILPVAYAVLMFISMNMQKIEGPNAAVMKIMPFIFVFFFWSIASGVILYFVVSMMIDVLQRLAMERMSKDEPLPEPEPVKKRKQGKSARKKS